MSSTRFPRLDQLLASLGYGSRREVEIMIKNNRVDIEGISKVMSDLRVDPDLIKVDGEALDNPRGILVMLNKPLGFVCSHNDEEGKLIYDLLPSRWMQRKPQVVTVGRLDKETSGLILITDNHDLVHKWTSPKKHVSKVYEVEVDRIIPSNATELFSSGTILLHGESKPCLPAELIIRNEKSASLVLHEGKYHQVRRMFASIGLKVTSLHRSQFGLLSLNNLKTGEFKEVSIEDVQL
jgi:16S rRNA pseudouridine516 synthase